MQHYAMYIYSYIYTHSHTHTHTIVGEKAANGRIEQNTCLEIFEHCCQGEGAQTQKSTGKCSGTSQGGGVLHIKLQIEIKSHKKQNELGYDEKNEGVLNKTSTQHCNYTKNKGKCGNYTQNDGSGKSPTRFVIHIYISIYIYIYVYI